MWSDLWYVTTSRKRPHILDFVGGRSREVRLYIKIVVTSSFCSGARSSTINMASFVTVKVKSANVFRNSRLLYVYCVSKEDFPVCPVGLGCVELTSVAKFMLVLKTKWKNEELERKKKEVGNSTSCSPDLPSPFFFSTLPQRATFAFSKSYRF